MTVQDLIDTLLDVEDKNKEIFFDVTPANSRYYHFKSIDIIDDVESPEGEKFIVLSCALPPPIDSSQN
jgi:hypothetical protein